MKILVVSNALDDESNSIWIECAHLADVQVWRMDIDRRLAVRGSNVESGHVRRGSLPDSFRIHGPMLTHAVRSRPQIVHYVGEPWSLDVSALLSVSRKVVVHGAENQYEQGKRVKDPVRQRSARWNLSRVSGAVGWTSLTLREMHRCGLPVTTPTTNFPAQSRRRRFRTPPRRESEDVRLIFLGRLSLEKDVASVLRALQGLGGMSLTVVGEGTERPKLERLASNLGVDATFMGYQSPSRVQGLLTNADGLVLPSIRTKSVCEQFGLVLVEAMAVGIPIIANRACAIPEVVGDAGLLVDPGVENWRIALTRFRDDDRLRKSLASKSWDRFALYNPEALARRVIGFWEELISRE